MNNRKSFIIYGDYKTVFEPLTMEQRGILLTAMLDFNLTGEPQVFSKDQALNVAWNMVLNNLKRDAEKYEKKIEENKIAGIIRALKSGQDISDENMSYMRDKNLLTKEYLSKHGIEQDVIQRLLKGTDDTPFY